MEGRIFISYSRKDLDAVTPIKEELEASRFSCWMDLEGIESGSEEFTEYIANALEQSRVLLFFLSDNSQTSRWSLNELRVARGDKKHVVLVRFNDDNMTTKFKLEFGGADIIDWRRQEQKAKLLKDLARWLESEASLAKADDSIAVGEAEKVFLSRARRFKTDDGVIDPSERKELDSLAERLGISILRREALIEQVECALGQENIVAKGSNPSSLPLGGGTAYGTAQDGGDRFHLMSPNEITTQDIQEVLDMEAEVYTEDERQELPSCIQYFEVNPNVYLFFQGYEDGANCGKYRYLSCYGRML